MQLLYQSRIHIQKWPLAILLAVLLAPGSAWLHLFLTAGLERCAANCPVSHCLLEHRHADSHFHGDTGHDHHLESSGLACETERVNLDHDKSQAGESSQTGESSLRSGLVSTGHCLICSHFSLALAEAVASDFEISNPVCRQELASRELFTQLIQSSYSARGPPLS